MFNPKNRRGFGSKKILLYNEKGGKCERCGCPLYLRKSYAKVGGGEVKAHVHHKEHINNGGTHDYDNLLLTCWKCECNYHQECGDGGTRCPKT